MKGTEKERCIKGTGKTYEGSGKVYERNRKDV